MSSEGILGRAASIAEVQEELRTILCSRTFKQAPRLARLLEYICSKAVLGQADVTEYTIALDVFGKPPDFKESKDAIVRVEVHRLRRRLARYYDTEGAASRIRIVIPSGRYSPEFVIPNGSAGADPPSAVPTVAEAEPEPAEVEPQSVAPVPARPAGKKYRTALFLSAAVLLLLVVTVGGFVRANLLTSPKLIEPPRPPGIISPDNTVRVLAGAAGGSVHTDSAGRTWQADLFYKGGVSQPGPKVLMPRPPDSALFQTMREGLGSDEVTEERRSFSYDIPARRGTYELRLYFADPLRESTFLERGQDAQNMRRFRVNVNGEPILQLFDATADAGSAGVDVRAFKNIVPAADGMVHIQFLPDPERPFVNAIELVPAEAGRANPIRITARPSSFTDETGKTWMADNYFQAGRWIRHPKPGGAPSISALYDYERYGNFSYAIPVPQGSYTVVLHFAETIFTPFAGSTLCRGPGCRVFDVTCNGVVLLHDLDVFSAAGGGFIPLVRTFHGLQPNGQGKLQLSFSPRVNYGEVRAIEILDEAQ